MSGDSTGMGASVILFNFLLNRYADVSKSAYGV